jgi:hypothetical protein
MDNGIILFVWAADFLCDMLIFEAGRASHSPFGAAIGVTLLNGAILAWRVWYAKRLPIRPLRSLANRVIFWWSWCYIALIGVGVDVWAVIIGSFPPGWFTLLDILGALLLAVAGYRLYKQAHA